MNFIYSFIIFEAGAFFGFFVAALLNAARAGQEITIKGTANHAGTTPTRLPVLTIRQSRKCLKNGCVLSVILFAQCTKQNVNSFTHMSFHLQSIIRGKLHMQLTQRFAYSAKKMWIPR